MGPALVLLAGMLLYPIIYTVWVSLSDFDLATFQPGGWVGLRNYQAVLADPGFLQSLKVTGVYLVIALPLQMILGFALAFLLNVEWRGRGLLRALFLIPMVVAPVVAGGVWRMLLDPLWGVVNYALGLVGVGPVEWIGDPTLAMVSLILIDTWRWTPFVVLIASAGILALPTDVYEAARSDGANRWQILRHVTIPLLVPVVAAAFVVRWLGAVKMFDIALAATKGGPGQATDVVNLYIYEKGFRGLEFGSASSMATVVLLITMIITYFLFRLTRRLENRW
ncbi:ABC transporter permease [Sphaerisporangium siamense]|uniref:Multiple sugar transport system permease protein n=1 Tax=Sphaerisporangium siamense TaxID=795645 RepID=A0A7W7D3W7_9ACTN|nr:sugar ABC transporter permease [Sphaerisporangium siamense]MBB4699514.1 multiple sugar transport system permease protein [Sphaerisporangium siamense]GII86928.1 ABC transporter permease [Sphaerisporangium siamense]